MYLVAINKEDINLRINFVIPLIEEYPLRIFQNKAGGCTGVDFLGLPKAKKYEGVSAGNISAGAI